MSNQTRNGGESASTLRPGARYVVRHRLDPEASHDFTDTVGELLRADVRNITLRTRRHGDVEIDRRRVTAVKEIPPTPGRRGRPHQAVGIEDLQRLGMEAWSPTEREPLGDWTLRAGGGYTGRANAALMIGQPDRPLPQALDAVAQWYDARRLPALGQLPLPPGLAPDADPLVVEAAAAGWEWFQLSDVMTASTREIVTATQDVTARTPHIHEEVNADTAAPSPHNPTHPQITVQLTTELTDAWWSLADERMLATPASARAVLTGSAEQIFLTASLDGRPAARARLAFGSGWGGIYAVATAPEARGRGLASTLLGYAAQTASDHGASSLHLQVSADNSAAIALYEKLGFTRHHQYVYLRRAQAPQE